MSGYPTSTNGVKNSEHPRALGTNALFLAASAAAASSYDDSVPPVKGKASQLPPTASTVTASADNTPLTHYHSFFSSLIAWENPRSSAIAYASIIIFILAVRYLDVLRWGFKLTWMLLGISLAGEVIGKLVLGNGLTSQIRPRKYYIVSRETFDTVIGDVHELVNFFVIEAQRVFFAENVWVSAAACFAAFVSYFLVKIVPYWGLALIGTTVIFIVPLIYTSNQELIDEQIKHASDIAHERSAQFREVANQRAANYTQLSKKYAADYTARAQAMIRNRGKAAAPAAPAAGSSATPLKSSDFPTAPKEEIKAAAAETKESVLA